MKTTIHKADSRGHADHGWLDTRHTFSFANYYNPERMNFGVLRVLNDDIVEGGKGFNTHPHANMEIISIPLEGELEHKDSMGNTHVIRENDIQVMSAGTGIMHSEYNRNPDKKTNFLQIWIIPSKKDVQPRYDQMSLNPNDRLNKLQQIASPHKNDEGVWMHQDAWFYRSRLETGNALDYRLNNSGNGVYFFMIEGKIQVEDIEMNKRDGLGVWDTDSLHINAVSNAEILMIEIPMTN